jgi:cation transport protein ChaC
VAFRVSALRRIMTLEYLRAREQVTAVYRETFLTATLDHGEKVLCAAYVVDRKHPQYAGRLPETELARLILQGHGISGRNTDYIMATNQHFLAIGVQDPVLRRLSNISGTSALGRVTVL